MPKLIDLKGQTIVLYLMQPLIEQKYHVVATRLVEIEDNGLWIEGKDLAEHLEKTFKQSIPKMPIFFVPFAQIGWIASGADYPYLSEISLGVKSP